MFLRQRLDGSVDGGFEFALFNDGVRIGALRSRMFAVVILLLLLHGDFAFATATADLIEDEVLGDRVKPGGELRGGLVAGGGTPDADEDLLGDVVGVVHVVQHPGHGADHAALVKFDQLLKGPHIPFADAKHEPHVFVVAGGVRGWGSGGGRRPVRHFP